MRYFKVEISPHSKYMKTIITKFGKFRYNWFLMGICKSGYRFQVKIEKLISDIEGFYVYIVDILVLSKDFPQKYKPYQSYLF